MRALVIMTYQSAEQLCKMHRSSWLKNVKPDVEIYAGGSDKGFWSAPGAAQIRRGRDAYPDCNIHSGDRNMPERLAHATADAYARGAKTVVVIEPDVWFWGEPPLNDGITCRPFWEKPNVGYLHGPYVLNGPWGKKFSQAMLSAALAGESSAEWGSFPDRFAAHVATKYGIPIHAGNQVSFNTIESENQIQEALTCRANGGYAVHGIKNTQTLTRLAL